MENVETAVFYTNKDIDKLIRATENQVTADLEGGDRSVGGPSTDRAD